MYGYNDYHGPSISRISSMGGWECNGNINSSVNNKNGNDNDDDEDWNPLRPGLWMDGDSLAPPCGSSVSVIHDMLQMANLVVVPPPSSLANKNFSCTTAPNNETMYDLGCGDGRVCLEAYVKSLRTCLAETTLATTTASGTEKACSTWTCIGIETEDELIERFHFLITKLEQNIKELEEQQEQQQPPTKPTLLEMGDSQISSFNNDASTFNRHDCRHHHLPIFPLKQDLRHVLQQLVEIDTRRLEKITKKDMSNTNNCNGAYHCQYQPYYPPPTISTASQNLNHDDLPLPTIIFLYLLPEAIQEIQCHIITLMKANPALRVICNTWGLSKDIQPSCSADVVVDNKNNVVDIENDGNLISTGTGTGNRTTTGTTTTTTLRLYTHCDVCDYCRNYRQSRHGQ